MKSMTAAIPTVAAEATKDVHVKLLRMRHKNSQYPDKHQSRQQGLCRYCGYQQHHPQQKCPATGAECRKCGRRNHFAKVCRSGSKVYQARPRVQEFNLKDSSDDDMLIAVIENNKRDDSGCDSHYQPSASKSSSRLTQVLSAMPCHP